MEKEFIPYEQALALKELGFDEPCIKYYWTDGMFVKGYEEPFNYNKRDNIISSPLYQQAFRWFREKYNLYSEICLDSYKEPYFLKVTIKKMDDTRTFVQREYHPYANGIGEIDNIKYEEAELACLKKLIEIVKTLPNEQH